MMTKVQRWGNSLGVRIPKAMAQGARVVPGMDVEMTIESGRLVISPRHPPAYDLESLLAQITPENVHGEVDLGRPAGREIW